MTDTGAACRHATPATSRPPAAPTGGCDPARAPRCALETLYRDERRALLAYLAREAGEEHAKDLVQEVFLRAAGSAQFTELRNPGGFLRRIARNLVIDEARRRKCRIRTLSLNESRDAPLGTDQEAHLHARDIAERCNEALADLPDKTVRIFSMNRFEMKSYRQIHLELGIALPTVDYHMMKALEHLRARLADWR